MFGLLRTLVVFLIFYDISTLLGSGKAPGPDYWLDESGQRAPAKVRAAADAFWGATESYSFSSCQAGWGYLEDTQAEEECHTCRLGCCIVSLGLSEIFFCVFPYNNKSEWCYWRPVKRAGYIQGEEFTYGTLSNDYTCEDLLENRDEAEFKSSWNNLLRCVNESVKNPEEYHGDIDLELPSKWIINRTNAESWIKSKYQIFHRGIIDLTLVPDEIKLFVNDHGGWIR